MEVCAVKMAIDPDIADSIHVASCTLETRAKALRFVAALRKTVDLVFPIKPQEPRK